MEFALVILYTAIFIFLIKRWRFFNISGITRIQLSILFVLKIAAGTIMALIYTYYYDSRSDADIYKYFDAGNVIFQAIYENPIDYFRMLTGIGGDSEHLRHYYIETDYWYKKFNYHLYNDNRTIIRFNAFIQLFSFGYYHVHTVFMCFLSFVGLTAIYKSYVSYFKGQGILLAISVFLLPSVLFWTSGVLKEGIVIFALGLLLYNTIRLLEGFSIIRIGIIVLAIITLLANKFYILVASIPGIIFLIVSKWINPKYSIISFIAIHLIYILFAANFKYIAPDQDFIAIISSKQNDFINLKESVEATVGSGIELNRLEPNIFSFIRNTPNAIINSTFRPFISEANSLMMLISAIEKLFIGFIMILSILFIDKSKIKLSPVLFFALSFTLILFILTGLSTPVLGALVRYNSPALPFLFMILLYLMDTKKLFRIFTLQKTKK